ncbi:MAG: hypothetical protein ABWX92_17565 [Mycetocola sp.]
MSSRTRDRSGALQLAGRAWREDGGLSARYWSEATKERTDVPGVFYFRGERPRDPNAPTIEGTGQFLLESADRGAGYFTTRSDIHPDAESRTSGVVLRADSEDANILDAGDNASRAALLAEKLGRWKEILDF